MPLPSLLDAGSEVSSSTVLSRLRCHDGPSFRGRARVCLVHDSIEARWAATARLTHSAGTLLDAAQAAALADNLAGSATSDQRCALDRLSLLVRAWVGEPHEHGPLRPVGRTQSGADTPLSRAGHLPPGQHPRGVRYEIFVSVSVPETALGRAAVAAGGGLTGRALALYRLLDAVDSAASSSEVGSLTWLSSPALADAVRAGYAPAGLTRIPGTPLINSESAGSTQAPVDPRSTSAYSHGRSTTISYRVGTEICDPVDTFTGLLELASKVQPGEQRCVVLHWNIDGQARPRQSYARPIAGRSGHQVPLSYDAQPSPHRLNAPGTMISEGVARRCSAGVACTVAAQQWLVEHTARLEQDAAGRCALLPQADQQTAFLTTCMPVGIGPRETSAAR